MTARSALRGALACLSFAIFFGLAAPLSLLTWLAPPPRDLAARRRFTTQLNRGFRLFLAFLRDVNLIEVERVDPPPGLEGRAFLLVANHPTLLDAPLLLAAMPELVALVKASWYRTAVLGPLLRRCTHVPGPGSRGDEGALAPVVDRIERALSQGHPVLAFPEATRSGPHALRRFRRGAIEAALRADVPIAPVFIGVDPLILGKGQAPWRMPDRITRYRFEWLEPVTDDLRARGSAAVAAHLSARLGARLAEHRASVARALGEPTRVPATEAM